MSLERPVHLTQVSAPPGPCWLEIDLDTIESNVRALRAALGSGVEIAAVVKAQAYGLGAPEVACAAVRAGATWLAVARVREGIALRTAGLKGPILVLTHPAPSEIDLLVQHGLTATVTSSEFTRALARRAEGLGRVVDVHLKVDTGLIRYGAEPEQLWELVRAAKESGWLNPEGLYTHFASADEPDLEFTHTQLTRFEQIRQRLAAQSHVFKVHHAANSAAAVRLPAARYDLVRLGILLSGHAPSPVAAMEALRPAASFKAVVARIYDLHPGTTIGYGRTYTVQRAMRVALIPAGYADGVPRSLSNRGCVLIHGQRAPMVGRISMDQCVVDVTGCGDVCPGDEAVLFGRQGEAEIDLYEYAAWADTIAHEALCRIGGRVPRVYLRSGQVSRILSLDGAEELGQCAGTPGN